jgi:hypothetical protein
MTKGVQDRMVEVARVRDSFYPAIYSASHPDAAVLADPERNESVCCSSSSRTMTQISDQVLPGVGEVIDLGLGCR